MLSTVLWCWLGVAPCTAAQTQVVRQGGAVGFGRAACVATGVDPSGHLRLDWDRGAVGLITGNLGHPRAVSVPITKHLEGAPPGVAARTDLDILFDGARTRGLTLDHTLALHFSRPVWVSQIRFTTEAVPSRLKPQTVASISWDGRSWRTVPWRPVAVRRGAAAKPVWLTVTSVAVDRPARWVRLTGGYVCEVEVWGSAHCAGSGQLTSEILDLGAEQVVTNVRFPVNVDRRSLERLRPASKSSARRLPPPSRLEVAGTLRWDASARSDFPANTTLHYCVTAVGPGGESAPTPLVSVRTGDPAPQVVDLRWSGHAGARAYRVYRGVRPNRLALVAAMEAPNPQGAETRLLDMGYAEAAKQVPPSRGEAKAPSLPRGLTVAVRPREGHLAPGRYYYRLSAMGHTGETVACDPVEAVVRAPRSAVQLRWTEVTGATGYRVFRSRRPDDFHNAFLAQTDLTPRFVDTGQQRPGCRVGGFVRVGASGRECADAPWQALPLPRGQETIGRFVQYRLVMSTALRTVSPMVPEVAVHFRRQWPSPTHLSKPVWSRLRQSPDIEWLDLAAGVRRHHFLVTRDPGAVRLVSSGAGAVSWPVDRPGRFQVLVVFVDSPAGDEAYALYHNDRLVGKFWGVANDDAPYAWCPAAPVRVRAGDVLTLRTIGPRLAFHTVLGWGLKPQ